MVSRLKLRGQTLQRTPLQDENKERNVLGPKPCAKKSGKKPKPDGNHSRQMVYQKGKRVNKRSKKGTPQRKKKTCKGP